MHEASAACNRNSIGSLHAAMPGCSLESWPAILVAVSFSQFQMAMKVSKTLASTTCSHRHHQQTFSILIVIITCLDSLHREEPCLTMRLGPAAVSSSCGKSAEW